MKYVSDLDIYHSAKVRIGQFVYTAAQYAAIFRSERLN